MESRGERGILKGKSGARECLLEGEKMAQAGVWAVE